MPRHLVLGKPSTFAWAPPMVALHQRSLYPFAMPEVIQYTSVNDAQRRFLNYYGRLGPQFPPLDPVLRLKLAQDSGELQQWFAGQEMKLEISPFKPAPAGGLGFGLGALLGLSGGFNNATRETLATDYGSFPGVGVGATFLDLGGAAAGPEDSWVAAIETEFMDEALLNAALAPGGQFPEDGLPKVTLSVTPIDQPLEGLDLLEHVLAVHEQTRAIKPGYGYINFPFVNLRHQVPLDWMENIATVNASGNPVVCTAAQQTNWLRISDQGFVLASGTAMGMASLGGSCGPTRTIRTPFLAWLAYKDGPPLFAAYLPPEAWGDPGALYKPFE